MGSEIILGVMIMSLVIFSAVASRWVSQEWPQAVVVLARSLGRAM